MKKAGFVSPHNKASSVASVMEHKLISAVTGFATVAAIIAFYARFALTAGF